MFLEIGTLDWRPAILLKRGSKNTCFPVDIAKFSGTTFYRKLLMAASKVSDLNFYLYIF